MSSAAAKWREEQILIICPGSKTTMAQLGCTELTPPTHRIPTRMFRDGNEWRPYYTFKRTKVVDGVETEEWVEDVDGDEGAVWPIRGGRIVRMDAFLAFLEHVHSLLTTTYHNTPIMLMASPQWTRPDCEAIAQYVFEKTRTPALCMIHSGLATQYGLKWPNMTVIDIGYEKVDVTAIHDGRVVNQIDLGSSGSEKQISGGEIFTRRLQKLLGAKNFTYDMAEKLKKSPICEVLPYAAGAEDLVELPKETVPVGAPPPAAAAESAPGSVAEPAPATELIEEPVDGAGDSNGDSTTTSATPVRVDDGVLDVAAIVTSGQTKEFLARKEEEKEKEKKKAGRKLKAQQDAEAASSARPVRLPNSKRKVTTFTYEEVIQELVAPETSQNSSAALNQDGTVPDATTTTTTGQEDEAAAAAAAAATEAPSTDNAASTTPPEHRPKRVRRDIEIGLERFTFADRHEIDRIVTAIYHTIQGIDDMYMRPPCWDNLVFVGNGSRLRGLKENILQTLQARHLVSPSTATMFTSELPSNVATPTGTGAQTPTGSFNGGAGGVGGGHTSGVNPLLQAATTASTLGVGGPGVAAGANNSTTPAAGSEAAGPTATGAYHFHSQTPTSIKTAVLPTYLSEWTKNGFEEAMFLGAQVAARIAFSLHGGLDTQGLEAQRLMSLSRVDYNELGPKGIRKHSMLQ
ncbi:hypothetical protein E4U13_006671 [Claviceps humidiphila]|uniref:Actin-related protein n=1 Tax=Claviceps humidiphila TaxID=1294629 RepID=A0A9P7Q9J2_9HYPO|nr:hypothetical protein E4U13_006671 [Claviceps humidiphila]